MPYSGDIDKIASALAQRAALVRLVPPTANKMTKMAENDWLSQLGDYAREAWESPALRGSLIGAGVGGLGGALVGRLRKDEEDRSPWRSALTGAALGGLTGFGIGKARSAWKDYKTREKDLETISSYEKQFAPGPTRKAVSRLAGSFPLAASAAGSAALYHTGRNIPFELVEGTKLESLGRQYTPEQVWELAKNDPDVERFAKRVSRAVPGGSPPAGLSGFERFEAGLKEVTGKPTAPMYLRKEWKPFKRLAPAFHIPGSSWSRLRGGLGTIAALALPYAINKARLLGKEYGYGPYTQEGREYRDAVSRQRAE